MLATIYKHVWRFRQIGIYVSNIDNIAIVENPLLSSVIIAKSNDNDVNMRLGRCFTIPSEGAVSKIYSYSFGIQRSPKVCHLLTLANGIGGHQSCMDISAYHDVCTFLVPCSHVVEVPDVFPLFAKNFNHVRSLAIAFHSRSDKRWISNNIGQPFNRNYILPIDM